MKILIVGSTREWALENHYIKHLNNQGQQVTSFPAHDIFYAYYYKHLINKFQFRLGFSSIYKNINNALIQLTQTDKFDVLWVFKGMEIFPETLEKIKKKGVKIVNFNPDHPFLHTFKGSGNKNVLKSISKYDLHLCYSLQVKERIEEDYGIQCEWLPFGYEKDEIVLPTSKEEIARACFIGNPDAFRASVIQKLLERKIPIDLYGNFWAKWMKGMINHDLKIFPPIYKSDFNKVATQYRLQLNIFRPHNDNSHNMRTFEMPGLGCIMLAPASEEHNFLFNDNEEAFFYTDFEDMVSKANQILNMDYETALAIRNKAMQQSINSGYSYQNRANQVIEIFERLL